LATTAFVQAATGGQLVSTTLVTSTQILALGQTPGTNTVQLIAAPGAGYQIMVDKVIANLQYGGTAYSAAAGLSLDYYNGSTLTSLDALISTTGLAETFSWAFDIYFQSSTQATNLNLTANSSILLTCASAPTLGNSNINFIITYRIIAVQ
jgi:hypothetical protein